MVASPALPRAQTTDLDAFMKEVLARRDDNWKKLQQYTLDEDETFQVSALDGRKIYGFKRAYTWYPQDGIFVRSPVTADGVKLTDKQRRDAEQEWLKEEQGREKRRIERDVKDDDGDDRVPAIDDLVKPGNEPRFVSSAYFLRFKFDPGHYALVGREELLNRQVLRIEYYPTNLFREGRTRPNKQVRKRDEKVEEKFNKVALITLWIEPSAHQILQYEFSNIDFDFMPARQLVRLDDLRASMRMCEAFPQVWLPDTIAMRFRMTMAFGDVGAKYDVRYHDYKLAEVKTRVR